jgi:alpha-beta hydrolase superfamily lysophospholipase
MKLLASVGTLLLTLAVIYLLIVLAAFMLQRQLLYFPAPAPPTAAQLAVAGLHPWPAGEAEAHGFVGAAQPNPVAGTVLVFHGNAGAAWQRSYYVDALHALGYRVILAEYPGYGGRSGSPSEAALVADAQETLRIAYAEFGAPIYLWGESLGSGVAAAVAAAPVAPIAGLALITPWATLPDLAQGLYPFLPVRWLLRDRYDNMRNLAGFMQPVAAVIAERDEIIDPVHAERLYASLRAPKQRWVLPNVGHNTWPTHPTHPWWREVMRFLAGTT